jgi:hypothetical protein
MQVLQVYAQDIAELESEKNTWIQTLSAVEQAIDSAVEKLDDKIVDKDQSDQLQEKHEEVEEYLEKVEEKIQNENSWEDIRGLVEEAKKVVVLKVVSWVTEYEDVEENIPSDVANTSAEIEDAMESIQDSMLGENDDYSLIITTQSSKKKVEEIFHKFDENTSVELMYKSWGKKYFEILLKKDSIFRQEILEDIESWTLPESFIGMDVVLPEVYVVEWVKSAEKVQNNLLEWEDLSHLWEIEKYQAYRYFSEKKSE